jgi:serine/threonine protein kinase
MSLNDYTILNKIGQGQFGIVFKAIRKSDNIPVAIKIISKKLD